MAVEFSKHGWKIAGGARNSDTLESLKKDLQSEHFIYPFNVTNPEEVDIFAAKTEIELGVPDLLINNAGIINKNAPLTQVSPKEFASILAVNLGGIHNMIRAFVPMMENKGRGIIANFSSYWGQATAPEVGPYCTSKWGVEGLTRSLSQELPSGFAAVAFNPGIIDTEMLRMCFGADASTYEKPDKWAIHAVDTLSKLSPSDNGNTILG